MKKIYNYLIDTFMADLNRFESTTVNKININFRVTNKKQWNLRRRYSVLSR